MGWGQRDAWNPAVTPTGRRYFRFFFAGFAAFASRAAACCAWKIALIVAAGEPGDVDFAGAGFAAFFGEAAFGFDAALAAVFGGFSILGVFVLVGTLAGIGA